MWLVWVCTIFAGVVAYYVLSAQWKFNYWRKKSVPGPRPLPFLGHFVQVLRMGQSFFDAWVNKKFGKVSGYFDGSTPVLLVSDPDMLRSIFVKDFSHFVNRRDFHDLNGEVLANSVDQLRDQRWKDVRSVLVPTFTSGRLKQMNDLINECCDNLILNISKKADDQEEIDCKKLYRTVTMDVIASTFFATKIDSQNDPNNAFVKNAVEAFNISFLNPMFIIFFLFPWALPLAKRLGMQVISKDNLNFFIDNTKEIIKLRTEHGVARKDFLQIMLKSLKGAENNGTKQSRDEPEVFAEENTSADIISHSLSVGAANEKSQSHTTNYKLSTEEIVAQSIIFFLAGFETTAISLTFLTYLPATHQEIQDKLRQNIEDVMQDNEKPTYELIAEMHYLDACVNEALRLYPPASRAERECNQDWEYNGLKVEKGTLIAVPIFAIHRNPEYWPNPEVYDPERFSYENKQNIKPYTFNTFGQGPRNCIGMRFAHYEIKMVIVQILRNFRIVPSTKTEIPLVLKDDIGLMSTKNGVWVSLERL